MTVLSGNPIPLLNLGAGLSDWELAEQVKQAVASVGFLHIKGTAITQEMVNSMFAISDKLYSAPFEERAAFPKDRDMNGYNMLAGSRLSEGKGAPDLKEDFVFGRYGPDADSCTQQLPPSIAQHRDEILAFHAACHELTCTILDAFSLALNLPKSYFRERHVARTNGLSMINYPAIPAAREQEVSGAARASAHKDWGSITLLFQEEDGTAGLEVFLPDQLVIASAAPTPYILVKDIDQSKGQWYAAPNLSGTVLVNVGLQMEAWTGGLAKATLHRVVPHPLPEGGFKARRSMPYFARADDDVVLNPIDSEGRIKVTPDAKTSAVFFEERLRATLLASKA